MSRSREAKLEAALAAAQARVAALEAELATVRGQLHELLHLAATQNEHLSDMRTMLRRKLTARKKGVAEAEHSTDPEGETSGDPVEAAAAEAGPSEATTLPPPESAGPKKRARKPRAKGTGRQPPPAHLPIVELQGEVCRCAHCGSDALLARDREVRVRIDAVETIARLRREVLEVVRCRDCGQLTTAPPPSLPCPRAKFTCGFLAWLVTMKFALLVPLNRIARLLASQGVVLPKSTLVRLVDLAATLAAPIDGVHWKELKARPCLLTDATGLQVIVKGAPEAWDAILDVFNGDETTVYQFALTKHGDEIAALLRGFQGVVLCDAESRLNELCRQEGVRRANCNAHPRRAFRDAEKSQPVLARQGGQFLARMYAIEHRAAAEGLSGPALLARRQQETRPIVDAFKTWLLAHETLLPSDPLGKVVRYYLRHWDGLTRFVSDADVPIDNNPSERAFQDHARLRFNSLFAGSAEGGRRWALLLGVVTTAKRHGLDVQTYLTWMFERRGTRRRDYGLSAAQLTPRAYKQMLDEEERRAAA
jgi:transposase